MRRLTPAEIDYLLRDVPACFPDYLLPEQKEALMRPMLASLRLELSRQSVHDDLMDLSPVREVLLRKTEDAIADAGEGVGILCAQSIGERQTQLTLNSFHSSGLCVATVVTGVPRFLELLNATKEPKTTMNSFGLGASVTKPAHIRRLIGDSLVHFTLHRLVTHEHVFLSREEEYWFGAFETVYGSRFRDYQAGITLRLDKEQMSQHKISLVKIKEKIEKTFSDTACVISPLYLAQIDIFVDTTEIFLPENLPSCGETDHIRVYLEQVVRQRLLEIDVCGIQGIRGYHYRKEGDRWHVQTHGSNFTEVLCLPYVAIEDVTSNNMWDIYNSFGIEATREFLIDEFTGVVSSDGTFINPAHTVLLVDIMTHQGVILSVSRYGMKKEQMGVLSRSSFEESLDHFCHAGSYAERDVLRSVSANIMCGKRAQIGSGLCNVRMDWDVIVKNEKKVVSAISRK